MTSVDVNTVRDSASDVLDQLQRVAEPAIKKAKRRSGVLLDESGALIDSVSTRTSQVVAELGNNLIVFTKKNPLLALLLAIGAGVLIASASRSPQSRR